MKSRQPPKHEISYAIEARAYDIVGVAAHDFWVLRDEKGRVIAQLHGLATDADSKIKPIGTFGDKLKFYHFGPRAILFGLSPEHDKTYIKAGQKSEPMFSGSPEKVLRRWDNAVKALPFLNGLDVPYTPFAILGLVPVNSNTAYRLLGMLMGIPVHYFSGYWQPGWPNIAKILSLSQLRSMGYPQDPSDSDVA